jgi:hypothetical protein
MQSPKRAVQTRLDEPLADWLEGHAASMGVSIADALRITLIEKRKRESAVREVVLSRP